MKSNYAKRFLNKTCEIKWVDIVSHHDVYNKDLDEMTSKKGLAHCKNWGIVRKVDANILILAHSMSSHGCSDIFVFPLDVVMGIQELK